MNKIGQTSPDKIRGKLVKYRLGDCLTIRAGKKYFGAIMTGKFNKYYNFTFMDFVTTAKPTVKNFLEGRLFGTRFGSWDDLEYGVDQIMVECKYVDNEVKIEKVGELNLILDHFNYAGYSHVDDVDQMLKYHKEELPVRVEKSIDAEKFPDLAFAGRHLIETDKVIRK